VHLAIPKEKWATFGRQDFANYVRQYIALPSHYGKHSPAVQEAIINHYSNHTQKSYAVEWDGQPGYWMKQTLDVYFSSKKSLKK
jgi:hypothetical protein